MTGRIDFRASVEANGCCFCGKPLVNLSEQTEKQTLTVQMTEGEALVLHYHEACFQESPPHPACPRRRSCGGDEPRSTLGPDSTG